MTVVTPETAGRTEPMTAANPPTKPEPVADPDYPRIRLDVSSGLGRASVYHLTGSVCVAGSGENCHLRLSGLGVPQQLFRLERANQGVVLRRLHPTFPILRNQEIVQKPAVEIGHGDLIEAAGTKLSFSFSQSAYVQPSFTPISESPPPSGTAVDPPVPKITKPVISFPGKPLGNQNEAAILTGEDQTPAPSELAANAQLAKIDQARQLLLQHYQSKRAELLELEAALHEERASLEQRKTLAEAELVSRREELELEFQSRLADYARQFRDRQQELEESFAGRLKELEVNETEMQKRRQAVSTNLAGLQTQQQELDREREQFEATRQFEEGRLAERERELNSRESRLILDQEKLEHDKNYFEAEQKRLGEDSLRLDRKQAELENWELQLKKRAEEVDRRFEQMLRDAAELEEQMRLVDAEQHRITAETERLTKLRTDLEGRASGLADQAARLESQQAMLGVLRVRLDRQHEELRQESARLDEERSRHEEARLQLQNKIREAEALRGELDQARSGYQEKEKNFAEQNGLLEAALQELAQQQDAVSEAMARLAEREAELDRQSTENAEQAAALKARTNQIVELQERLEADRAAVRERESTLTDADSARVTFQEQLRKRATELAERSKELDELIGKLADQRTALDSSRSEWEQEKEKHLQELEADKSQLDERKAELDRHAESVQEKEAGLARQVERLKQVGRAVAESRKQLAQVKEQWQAEQEQERQRLNEQRSSFESFQAEVLGRLQALREEAPALEEQARSAKERLNSARDSLRVHLDELHEFAQKSRADLETARASTRIELEQLQERELQLEKAKADHRLAVTQFRQQLLEWQDRVQELKSAMAQSETRIESRQAEVEAASKTLDLTSQELARQAEEIQAERQQVAERRSEVERHLSDMREWYRKKLRDLAGSARSQQEAKADDGSSAIAGRVGPELAASQSDTGPVPYEEIDPGDRQLGELLQSHGLVDADTLQLLWGEVTRQRRTLRQVLLASGVITLYQLALIEAENFDHLILGRFRVIDRVRATPRETVYRVFDPTKAAEPSGGAYLLRHLTESESQDAVRPDEFRQRFAALEQIPSDNLWRTVEVLELQGRPAVVQEWIVGLPGSDWPAAMGKPGVFVRLLQGAASGLQVAHDAGLVHGRLTSDSFVLTVDGVVKLAGVGEPSWLLPAGEDNDNHAEATDLRGLGQIANGWMERALASQPKRSRAKSFPDPLVHLLRRLEAFSDTPMADTIVGDEAFSSIQEFLQALTALQAEFPCQPADWEQLLEQVREQCGISRNRLRRSA